MSPRIHPPLTTTDSKEIQLDDLKWTLSKSSSFTESRNMYFCNELGQFAFIQLAYTTLSWSPSCQISFRYFDKRSNQLESYNIPFKKMTVIQDLSVTVNSSVVQLQLIHQSSTKLRVNVKGASLSMQFELDLECNGFKINDGNIFFGQDRQDGYINTKFFPRLKFTGTVNLNGEETSFKGNALVIHMKQSIKPYLAAREWFLVNFQSKETSFVVSQLESTKAYDSKMVNKGGLFHNNEFVGVSISNQIRKESIYQCPFSGYDLFDEIAYESNGKTDDGKDFSVRIKVVPTILCDRIDILAHLPSFLRKIIQLFITKPYCYQWLDKAKALIKIGSEEFEVEGTLFHEVCILNK